MRRRWENETVGEREEGGQKKAYVTKKPNHVFVLLKILFFVYIFVSIYLVV